MDPITKEILLKFLEATKELTKVVESLNTAVMKLQQRVFALENSKEKQ